MPLKLKTKQAEIRAEADAQKIEEQKKISFHLCVFGLPQIDTIQVPPGTTLSSLLSARNLEGIETRVNQAAVRGNYVIKEGDIVVVIPQAIEGGRTVFYR